MQNYGLGRGKWVFVDWMGVEPGYGTAWGGARGTGWCVPQGIELKVHPPAVDPNPAILPDRPWEASYLSPYASFIQEDGVYRCWYENGSPGASFGLAYAESADGLTWHKPDLGLVEWKGSRQNNLVRIYPRPLGIGVFQDPVAPPSERYKMVWCLWTETERQVLGAVSPDGLHWTDLEKPLLDNQHSDVQNIALYDEDLGQYVLYTRQRDGLMGRRGVNRTAAADFRHFPPSVPVLENDPLDPPDVDIYCNGYSRWPGATDAHLMRLSMYERTSDTINVHLATSRDGIIWHRPLGRTPWLAPAASKQNPYMSTYACAGIVPTATGEWSSYLGVIRYGHNEDKHPGGDTNHISEEAESGILRAVVREDGFTSLASRGRGEFWTIPFKLDADSIRLNMRTLYSGHVRCQILASSPAEVGSDTKSIDSVEGYTLDDCQPLSGDHIDAPLTWNGRTDLSHLRGRTVRLHFDLYKADLYAIRF